MGYDNPVVGGVTLIRQAIQSPNYVPGVSGWTINRDGSAEFNNVTVRGSVYVQDSAGDYVWLTNNPTTGQASVLVGAPGSKVLPNQPGALQSTFNSSVAAPVVDLWGPLSNANAGSTRYRPNINLQSDPGGGTFSSASAQIAVLDLNAVPPAPNGGYFIAGAFDAQAAVSEIFALDPTVTIGTVSPAPFESWHTVAPAAGWTLNGIANTFIGCRIRYNPDNTATLQVGLQTTGAITNTAEITAAVPAFFIPVFSQHAHMTFEIGGGVYQPGVCFLGPDGKVTVIGNNTAGTTWRMSATITYSLAS